MTRIRQYTVEQFLDCFSLRGCSISHDAQSLLLTSNQSGIFNAWVIDLNGGAFRQVTKSFHENTHTISFFPNDNRILLTRDRAGDENHHIFVLEMDGREFDLTPGEGVRAQFLCWSHDGKSFYLETNERDPSAYDVYRINVESYERTLLFHNRVDLEFGAISNDERHAAFVKLNSLSDSDVYLYTFQTKEMRHLTPHVGDAYYGCPCFDAQVQSLYFLSDEDSEYSQVVRCDLSNNRIERLERYPSNIWYMYFSHSAKYLVLGVRDDACHKIRVYEQSTGAEVILPAILQGHIAGTNISRTERYLAVYDDNDASGKTLFIHDLLSNRTRKLISNLSPRINSRDLVESKSIRYSSFDGVEIQALLWKPSHSHGGKKFPALIWVHGGPGGQTTKGYDALIQALANHGYVVLGVNYRGSSGFGKTFLNADDGKAGREPLWDCIEAKKYLASLDYVDPSSIGIMGISYGGYMVLAALAFHPDEFAVGVDMFGVSNWVRALASTPLHLGAYQYGILCRKVRGPGNGSEWYEAISPSFHARQIKQPLLVLQGANDPRVPRIESDDIVAAIRENGGIVEYILFDDEGHGFTKKVNAARAHNAILNFLDRYLKQRTKRPSAVIRASFG
jgi:protease II